VTGRGLGRATMKGVDHIVIPLGRDHLGAMETLAAGAAGAAGMGYTPGASGRHARRAIEAVVSTTVPFSLHAHGYGFFTGDDPPDLSLHVQVVRTAVVDTFHARLWVAITRAGADVAKWCAPDLWSPHITLLDRALDAHRLGAAAGWLARRHHPSWTIAVDRVAVTGGWPEHQQAGDVLVLGG
jgi:hypothetical protein